MERLHFGKNSGYSALEAAVHVSRYAIVKQICAGKAVLDAACGEGYGSRLMASWGASSVDGVDVSRDAIDVARRKFADGKVTYHLGDVTALTRLFADNSFDLIVSLETIEHVLDPELFLSEILRVAKSDATIVISCPNDHWYYQGGGDNPFHIQRYRLSEFKRLTEAVLGSAMSWSLGSLGAGFLTTGADQSTEAAEGENQAALLRAWPVETALYVPSEPWKGPTPESCSFFVGVWGSDRSGACAVVYPLSMDEGDRALLGGPRLSETQAFIDELTTFKGRLDAELAATRDQLTEVERARDEVAAELAATRDQLTEVERARDRVEADLATAREQLTGAERAQATSLKTVQEHVQQRLELSRSLRTTSLRLQAVRAENEALREYTAQLKRDEDGTSDRLGNLTRKNRELQSQADDLERILQRAQLDLATTRDRLAVAVAACEEHSGHLANVPWRVVGMYRKVRPVLPRSLLRVGAYIIDARRRK